MAQTWRLLLVPCLALVTLASGDDQLEEIENDIVEDIHRTWLKMLKEGRFVHKKNDVLDDLSKGAEERLKSEMIEDMAEEDPLTQLEENHQSGVDNKQTQPHRNYSAYLQESKHQPKHPQPQHEVPAIYSASPFDHHLNCDNCVDNSVCENGECVCKPGFVGSGYFYCAPAEDYHFCSTSNDPGMRTLGGENFVYHLVGSTRLVELTTEREGGGVCKFQLWGWTARKKGKYFFEGIRFRLDQIGADGKTEVRQGNIKGHAEEGSPFNWTVVLYPAQESNPPDDTFKTVADIVYRHKRSDAGLLDGCPVTEESSSQEYKKFSVSCCGIDFALRPFHPDHPLKVPGVWFQVKKTSRPTYETWDENEVNTEPLCLDHTRQTTVDDLVANSGVTSGQRDALTYHALTNTNLADYPDAEEGVGPMKELVRDCPGERRDDMFNFMKPFLDNPKFTHCLNTNDADGADSGTSTASLQGIRFVVNLVCHDSPQGAVPVRELLETPVCEPVKEEFPEIDALSNFVGSICAGEIAI